MAACVAEDVSPISLAADDGIDGDSVGEGAYASAAPDSSYYSARSESNVQGGGADDASYSSAAGTVTKVIEDAAGNEVTATLNTPYETPTNLKKNKAAWNALGGWPASKDVEYEAAKKDVARAEKYVEIADLKKEKSEIACPCEGENHYAIVQANAGRLGKAFGEKADAEAATANAAKAEMQALASATTNSSDPASVAASLNNKALDSDAHHGSWATYKKMLAKYGKTGEGTQSTWQKMHDMQLEEAKNGLQRAQLLEDQLLTKALPEFHQVKKDFPEIFANGKCPCPTGWTIGDAAVLASENKDDKIKEAEYVAKKVRLNKRDPTAWIEPRTGRSLDLPTVDGGTEYHHTAVTAEAASKVPQPSVATTSASVVGSAGGS